MKKRIIPVLMALIIVLSSFPVIASAGAAVNLSVSNATYYANGSLKSIDATFDWSSGGVNTARLILMRNPLNGSKGEGYGDFSDFGTYGSTYSSYNEAEDNSSFGFIVASNETGLEMYETKTMSLTIPEDAIDMNSNQTYYIYLWVQYGGHFYPDNLICVIDVNNNTLKYSPAYIPEGGYSNYYRNYYDSNVLLEVDKRNVIVIPGQNMTSTGNTTQTGMENNTAINTITITANNNCYFPEYYGVSSQNGIQVMRVSDTQLQITGTPTADTIIRLPDASEKQTTNTHTCQESKEWKYDANQHWHWFCTDPTCKSYQIHSSKNYHVFTDDFDTTCNTCGYVRTAPAEHPDTGDITHIPIWTTLFLGGISMLWLQLEQRKRERY